jgi:hypothetical protein
LRAEGVDADESVEAQVERFDFAQASRDEGLRQRTAVNAARLKLSNFSD